MKKILLITLLLLLCLLVYYTVFHGIGIASLKIASVAQMTENNDQLDLEIEEANRKLTVEYPAAEEELMQSSKALLKKKEEYLNLANISTDNEIKAANQDEYYAIEYLWSKIGNHATSEGVNLKFELSSGDVEDVQVNNLNFTVNGSYIGITNFIYAIENDPELNFRIENFDLGQGDGSNLRSTFIVRNIGIKIENVSQQ